MSEQKAEYTQPKTFAVALENFLAAPEFALAIIKSTAASFQNGWMLVQLAASGEQWTIYHNRQVTRAISARIDTTLMYIPAIDDRQHERLMQAAAASEPPADGDQALAALLDEKTIESVRAMMRGFLRNL